MVSGVNANPTQQRFPSSTPVTPVKVQPPRPFLLSRQQGSYNEGILVLASNNENTPAPPPRRAQTFIGTTGELGEGSGALGGLVAGGTVCSMWSAVSFLQQRRHHLRFGLPSGAALSRYLKGEALSSINEGVFCGGVLALGYM